MSWGGRSVTLLYNDICNGILLSGAGKYELGESVEVCAGVQSPPECLAGPFLKAAVLICGDDVTFDLNGHTLLMAARDALSTSSTTLVHVARGCKNVSVTGGALGCCMHGIHVSAKTQNVTLSHLDIFDFGSAGILVEESHNVHIDSCRIGPTLSATTGKGMGLPIWHTFYTSCAPQGWMMWVGRGTVCGIAATPAGGFAAVTKQLRSLGAAHNWGSGLSFRRLQIFGIEAEVQECVFASKRGFDSVEPTRGLLGEPVPENDLVRLRECARRQRGSRPDMNAPNANAAIVDTGFRQNVASCDPAKSPGESAGTGEEVMWARGVDAFCSPLRGAHGLVVSGWRDTDWGMLSDLDIEEPRFSVRRNTWKKPPGARAPLINISERWGAATERIVCERGIPAALLIPTPAPFSAPRKSTSATELELRFKGSFTIC
jgi:hypothetical protein